MIIQSILIEAQYVQRTMAECTQFLGAGRAGFLEILQNVRAIFAQNLRDLDAGLTRNLALERTLTHKGAATKFCGLRNNAGRVPAIFVSAARRNFSGTSHFFRASWAENLQCDTGPSPDACFFRI